MNKNIKSILHEKITLINLTKNNNTKNLQKSIKQNNNIKNNLKLYTSFLQSKSDKKNFFLSKKHKICLYTGRRSTVHGFNFSRYITKDLVLQNKFTNLKKHNF